MNLLLFGPPGAGKGTQAKLLSKRKNLIHVSTGDLLRETASKTTPIAKKLKNFMEKGDLVPDQMVIEIIKNEIQNLKKLKKSGFLIDGFPRTLVQAKSLETMLENIKEALEKVILIEVDSKKLIHRLTGRRVCENCKAIFHKDSLKKSSCPHCHSPLDQRTDDQIQFIQKRLSIYEKTTKPILQFYEAKNLVQKVKGEGDVEEVYQKIINA